MISLTQPMRVIEGHPVFQDHADLTHFHVAPSALQIAVGEDARPDIGLVQYAGSASDIETPDIDWGGLFSAATHVEPIDAALPIIKAALEEQGLTVSLLTPVNFDSGQATLALPNLDVEISEDGQEADPLLRLTTRLPGAGRLNAAFNTALKGAEAALLAATLERDAAPLLLSYELHFTGLRDALEVKIEADWERVVSSMEQELGVNVYYVSADVETAIKKAFQDADIKITSTSLKADATEDLAAAEEMLMDMAKLMLFESAPPLQPPAPTIADTVSDVASGLIETVVPGVRYKMKHFSLEDRKHIDLNLSRSEAESRPYFLHTTLSDALRSTLRKIESEDPVEDRLAELFAGMKTVIRVPDSPRLNLDVGVVDRFETDGLHSLVVEIVLPDPSGPNTVLNEETLIFSKSDSDAQKSVGFVLAHPQDGLSAPIRYRLKAELDPASPFERNGTLTGEWRETSARTLNLDPRIDLPYRVESVQILPGPGFSFAQYPNIGVELRHLNADEETLDTHFATLTAEQSTLDWHVFRSDADDIVQLRLTYIPPPGQGQAIVQDWRPVVNGIAFLSNPLPATRKLNIFNRLDFEGLQLATLELKYEDKANGHRLTEMITLSPEAPLLTRQYGIIDAAHKLLSYRLTVFSQETDLVIGDWRETRDANLIVSNDLVLTRQIRMRVLGDLAAENIRKVVLELRRRLSDTDVDTPHRIEFKPGGPLESDWTFGQAPGADKTLDVQAKFVTKTGQVQTLPWRETSRTLIVIRAAQREILV